MTVLSDILARKHTEIASLRSFDAVASPRRSLAFAVMRSRPSLIAEIKPLSPLRGRLIEERDVPALVDVYARHAQAISVLCDTATFGGGFELLSRVRNRTDLPVLAKDFILDRRQIDAAALHGADAVLLIVSLLTPKQVLQFAVYAIGLGMDVLLELHTLADAAATGALVASLTQTQRAHLLFGINNRDLHTQSIDLRTTERLAALLPGDFPLMSESGISSPHDIRRLAPRVQGFLIGSAILEADDPETFIRSLFPRS